MKRKFFLTTLLLLAAIGLPLSTARAQQVQVIVTPKYDPMPPQVMNYISQPGSYFNITLNNTSDEVQNVFLTMEVEQLVNGELHLITPNHILPNQAIVLPPNTPTPASSVALQNQFRHLYTSDIVLTGGKLSDYYDTGIVGLLPEGTYQLTIKAYQWLQGVKYPQLVSDPMAGKCTFNVCYSAQAPEITVPFYQSIPLSSSEKQTLQEIQDEIDQLTQESKGKTGITARSYDKKIAAKKAEYGAHGGYDSKWRASVVNNNAATFAWTSPIMNCGGTSRSYNYTFEVFPIGSGMSTAEQAVRRGTIALTIPKLLTPSCVLTPDQVKLILQRNETGYFVARVTATPTITDKSNMLYSTLENDGHSQLLVFRFSETGPINTGGDKGTGGDKNDEKPDEIVDIEPEPIVNEEITIPVVNTDYLVYAPKLVSPDNSVRGVLEENGKVELKWEKPEVILTPSSPITLNYKYAINVYKKGNMKSLEQALKSDPIITVKDLSATKYTIPWSKLKDKVKLNDNLVYSVTAACTSDVTLSVDSTDHRNVYQQAYGDLSDKSAGMDDCYADAADDITNKELAVLNEKQIRDLEVMIGEFPLTITNANLVDKTHYKGTGYISWYPFGKSGWPLMINVEFDELKINKEKIVYEGSVKSCREQLDDLSSYIPYDIFDDCDVSRYINSGSAEALGNKLDEYLQNSANTSEYYKYAKSGAKLIDDMIKNQATVNLPVSLSKSKKSSPFEIQILSATFSPTNAAVSVLGMLGMPNSDYLKSDIAIFGAPQICIDPESFAPQGATIALLTDFTLVDPETDISFDMKAPTNLVDLNDGCYMTFSDNGLDSLCFEAEMMIPGLIKADEKGNAIETEAPAINIRAFIKDWDNWIGTLSMDNFQLEEAAGFTFIPGGTGISYDHSLTNNAPGFTLPKNDGPVEYDKEAAGCNTDIRNWEGLYINKMGLLMPSFFDDESGKPVEISLNNLLFDDSGISFLAQVRGSQRAPIVKMHTSKAGGWGMSLESVNLNMISNKFASSSIIGAIKAPVIGGEWEYKTQMAMANYTKSTGYGLDILFEMTPRKGKEPVFDCFLSQMYLNESYTHFTVHNFEDETDVELELAGKITIMGSEDAQKNIPLDINIPGIEFTGMRMANFAPEKRAEQSEAAAKKFSYTFDPIFEGKEKGDFWFDLGTWSLSSEEKKLGPFSFSLDNFGIVTDNRDGKPLTGLNIVGSVGLLGESGTFTATAGVTVWAQIRSDLSNVETIRDVMDIKLRYAKTTLDEIGIKSEFGGCKVEGKLVFEDKSDDKKGYGGLLEFTLPGNLFTMKADGGFFKCTDNKGKFMHAYFEAEIGSATGIPLGPVALNDIAGGFYFNTSLSNIEAKNPSEWKKTQARDVHGGMFGLGLSTVGSDRGLNAKMKMVVVYDARRNRLSTFRMSGEVHALCGADPNNGLINADCSIVYQNLKQAEGGKYLQINITVDAGADMDNLCEQFIGQKIELPDGLSDLKSMEDKSTNKNKDAKDTKAKVSCGAHLALDIKVTMKPDDYVGNFKTKWHVYLGQPGDGSYESEMKNRCSITLIDYQVGGKNDPIAVWGKQWANAYLCIGNELPNDGALPPIPSEIKNFLDGKDANGQKQSLSATAEEKRKNIVTQFSGSASSGVMFGAQAGGEFGLNAVVCYANASLQGGFDIALTQLKPGTTCNGKPAGGSSGFYGTGQVYALAQGELGLMIDLWIFKGKLPLIDVGLGALLKGGFPNPSWFYGKVRAKCKLLGGLIKFNSSLTIEVGDVCIPDVGNPLDDIRIFGDMTPGDPEKSIGWEGIKDRTDGYSCYSTLGFTTNMAIGARLDLVDVNKANRMAGRDGDPEQYYGNCHRAYRFLLDPAAELYDYGNSDKPNSNPGQPKLLKYITKNQEDFTIPVTDGKLKACTYYKLVMKGKAQELINGLWQNPIFNDASTGYKDVQKDWTDEYSVYFHTTTLPNDLYQDVKLSFPFNLSGEGQVFRDDFVKPSLHLSGSRIGEGDDIFNPTKYTIRARVEKFEHGMWVPADATFKTRSTNGYAIDSNGDVNYFIKLDEKGNVVESQHDPFAVTYIYTDTRNSWKTINPTTGLAWERMYRFIDTLNELLTGTKDCKWSYNWKGQTYTKEFGTLDLYSKYATLRWVPTSYHSLNVAIKYYQELLTQDAKTYSNLSQTKTKLDALNTEIANTYSEKTFFDKSTYTYAVNTYEWKAISLTDADIQYTTCPAKHELTSSEKAAAQTAEKTVIGMHTLAKKELDEGIKVSDGKGGEVLKPHTSLHADEADKVKEDVAKCYEDAKKAFSQYLDKIYCSEESNTIKKYICSIGVLKDEAETLAAAIPVCKKSYNDVTMQKINILGLIADARLYANPKHTVEEYREEIRKDSLAATKALKKAIACYANHDYTMAANIDMKAICDSIAEFDKWTAIYKCEQGAMEAATKARKIWKEAIDYMAENPRGEREYGEIATFLSDIKIAYESALTYTNTSKYITEIKGYMDAISDSIHSDATLIKRDIESYYKIAGNKIRDVKFKAQDAMNSGKAFGITKRSKCIVQAEKLLDECYELVDEILNQRYDLEANYSSEVAMIAKYTDDDLKKMPGSTVISVKFAITKCEEYGVQAQEYYNAAKKYIQAQREFVESGKERTATVTANDTYTLSIKAVSSKSRTVEFITKLEGPFYIYDDFTTKFNNQEFPVDIIWGLSKEKADSYIQGFATIGTTATKKVDTSDSNGKATCYTYVALIENVSGGDVEMRAALSGRGLSASEATDMLRLTPPIVMGEGFASEESAESFARTFGKYTIKTIATKSCSAGETHSQRITIEDPAQKYDVVITKVGSNKNLVIRAVMDIMNCTNDAAKTVLSKTPPITVAYGVDLPVANSHVSKLKAAGASAKKTTATNTTTKTGTISKKPGGTAKAENYSDAWYAIPDASLLAMHRSTVPGVAEAHELSSEPDSKADAVPDAKAKPKAGAPAVPGVPSAAAASIISNMAASMNGKATPSEPIAAPASEAPTTPSMPTTPSAPAPPAEKVTGTPDDAYNLSGYDAANDILKKYANSNQPTEEQEKYGLTYYADPASIINNKTSALPVSYHCGNKNASDVIEESSDFKNPDNYLYHWLTIDESILDYFQKGVSYRITIEQIDNVKLVDYLNTQKVTQTHTEEAQLSAKDGNTFLDNKGKAEVDGTLDLAQYMADYYQEMKKEELFVAEEEKDVSKITNKKDTQKDMFVQHIYDWTVTVPSDVVEYETFTDYAKSIGEKWYNEHGRINTNYFPTYVRARPVAFKYYDERFSLANMHGMDDSQLFNNNFILKSPIVWLAYVGGYAFLNGRTIYDHTNFLAEDIYSPAALHLEFHSSPYRKLKIATPSYTNGSSSHREVANLIEQIGVCYQTPSYNECIRDRNKRNVVKELEEELQLIQDITKEVRLRYQDFRHATDKSRRTMIQQWLQYSGFDGSYLQSGLKKIGNEHSYMPKYQPYLMGMIDWWWCDHSSGDLDKYNLCCWQYGRSPEWSQGRNHLMPLYVAGGIKSTNYKIDYQFQYEDYCNNLEKIDFELFRVNCWNTRGEADGGGFDVNKGKSGFIYNLSVPEPLKSSAANYKLDTVEYNWDEY